MAIPGEEAGVPGLCRILTGPGTPIIIVVLV